MQALTLRSTSLQQAASLSALLARVRSLASVALRGACASVASLRSAIGYPATSTTVGHAFIGFSLRTVKTQGGNMPWTQAYRVQLPQGRYV